MRIHSVGRAVFLALLSACHSSQPHASGGPSPIDRRAELLAEAGAAASRASVGDFVTVLSGLFAPQGVYLSNTPQLLRGAGGARSWLERDSLASRSKALWTVVRHDVSADGRDGYTYGYFDVVHPAGDTLYGGYRAYWRRADSGRWEILAFARGRRAPGPAGGAFPAALGEAHGSRYPVRHADTSAVLGEIERTEAMFSDSVGVDVTRAFGTFAAPDAGKLESGPVYVFGKTAIAEVIGTPPPGQLGPVWRPELGSAATSGDLGFTLGPAWRRQPGAVQTAPPANAGRYFTIWKRQHDGSFRYLVD